MIAPRLYARVALSLIALASVSSSHVVPTALASGADVVIYASDVTTLRGHWSKQSSSGTAGAAKLTSTDGGWATADTPLASPSHYFDATFQAQANTPYRVWLRLRAAGNSKWNDSVWVQFSNARHSNGTAAYRIGSGSALLVNLERCNSCGASGWGWFNSAYWLQQASTVSFAASGTQTIRVQTREDGVEVDQIVLSPATYASKAPGALVNDTTIVPKSTAGPATPTGSPTPFNGSAVSLPGHVLARDYDKGAAGVAYHDTTRANAGATYRSDDVDLQGSSLGGHNIGWTAAGEWVKYTVNVATAGNYAIRLRAATPNDGTSIRVAFSRNGLSKAVAIPNTGGWQNWRDVEFVGALAVGQQIMTVQFPQGGINLHRVTVERAASSPTTSPTPAPGTSTGGTASPAPTSGTTGGSFRMMTWNIHHGRTTSGRYDPPAQARFIADQKPHVVVLQEVQTWDENQPARYKALLEQYTGVRWHMQWAPVNRRAATEGNVVLTRLPVTSSTYHQMHATGDHDAMYSNRSVAQATVRVGNVPVHVFSTHLDWYNRSHRTAQLLDMMAWTERFGPRRVVGGDFNSWWGEYWIITMMGDYYDTWLDLTGRKENGHTVNGTVRFDYLFRSKEGSDKVRPTKIWVPSTSLSDHAPVVADYTVRP